ncbi:DUF3592 domain-containing protein [Hymenobacter norwichensis]|uniref:DUF3592 domain-containing protein n=1 Tax=Hymenobacter norwichensis TaxID=223903 RepID=UPI0003B4111E|nr:DUF3592 domain-containing protein [Hymenobacter norwichensis]
MNQLFFFCCAILIIVTLFVLCHDNKKSHSRIDILRHGIRVPGEIIDLKFFGLFHRFPIVRFTASSGELLTFTSSDKVHFSEVKKGQNIEVCYLPVAPQQFVIVSGLDVLVASETEVAERTYRLAKGQERRINSYSRPQKRK